MADISRTVEIIFGAIDQTGGGITSVSDSLQTVINNASNVTAPLSDAADYALRAEAAVLAMGAAFLTVAVNEASRFGEKIEEIGSLVNASPEQYASLKRAVQEFAISSTSNFEQIGQAVYIATSNLGNTAAAMDVLTIAERGAIVGATDLEATAALLTRTMNAYGLVTDDSATNTQNAERVMAAMFATVQSGDTNMALLSQNLGRVSSTASAANVPIETVGAAIAALTGAGINTSESMTLLSALLRELLNPSDALSASLGGLSVATDGLPAIMTALRDATGGSAERFFALFRNSEAAKGAMILANDEAGKFDRTLTAMNTAVGSFNSNYANMAGGVEDSSQALANSARVLLQQVGDPLQDSWAGILDGLSAIMRGFSMSVDQSAFAPVFTAFDAFGDDLAQTLNRIGANLPAALAEVDFSGLIASFRELGFEMGDLFGDIDLSTPQGLASAIQFVVDSFESLTRVVAGIVDAWGPVVQGFIAGIDASNGLDAGTQRTVGNLLGLSQVFETLKGALLSGTTALNTIGNALTAIAGIQAGAQVTALATAMGGAGLATGAATLGAVGVALYGVYTGVTSNLSAWDDYKNRQDIVATSSENLAENQTRIAERLAEISRSTGVVVNSMDDLNSAVDDGRLVFDDATGAYQAAGSGVRDYDAEVRNATNSGSWFADAVNEVAASLGVVSNDTARAVDGFATLAEAEQFVASNAQAGAAQFVEYRDGLYRVTTGGFDAADSQGALAAKTDEAKLAAREGSAEWQRVQDVMIESQRRADDFQIAMGRLANERYEIDVRANVDLQVAQIEADTARIAAAFTAASEAISTLTAGTTDLYGLFAQQAGFLGSDELLEAAQRMENRLDEELELKRALTEAQLDMLGIRRDLLLRNGGQIIINADTLAPELELVLRSLVEHIQVQANAEGLEMLL